MRKADISPGEVVICDGQRPQGAIVPRSGRYEAHLANGRDLGRFDSVPDARRAILEADKALRGAE
jgi:hypothetical protein